MKAVIGLVVILAALIGIIWFVIRPTGSKSLWRNLAPPGTADKSAGNSLAANALLVLVALELAQLLLSGAISATALGLGGNGVAILLVLGVLVIGATALRWTHLLALIGAGLGVLNVGIQHGMAMTVMVLVLVLLLLTVVAMINKFTPW